MFQTNEMMKTYTKNVFILTEQVTLKLTNISVSDCVHTVGGATTWR